MCCYVECLVHWYNSDYDSEHPSDSADALVPRFYTSFFIQVCIWTLRRLQTDAVLKLFSISSFNTVAITISITSNTIGISITTPGYTPKSPIITDVPPPLIGKYNCTTTATRTTTSTQGCSVSSPLLEALNLKAGTVSESCQCHKALQGGHEAGMPPSFYLYTL